MSNLLGEPFEDYVREQINARQKALGKYSTTQIQANLIKTPFIRLASSIDLEGSDSKDSVPQKLKEAGFNVSGVELAKKSILYGGVVSMTGENSVTQNSSINDGKSPFNGAYGWGGIDERGYVPMPGITDVSVQYQNNGALSKATVNIKCFSKKQFQIIDVLYLRPGYSLLLEFGHSTYLNNSEEYDSFESFSTKPLRTLFNPGSKSQYDIYGEIEETRKEHDGNYEAVYGKITTFKWSFNKDGSYNCQLTLTGMGDVIESLKMNISVDKEEEGDGEEKNAGEENDDPPLISNRNKSKLNKILYQLFQVSEKKSGAGDAVINGLNINNYPNPKKGFQKEKLPIKNSFLTLNGIDTPGWGILGNNQTPQAFLNFGALLAIIQTNIVLHDNSRPNTSVPLFRFDMEFDNLKNDENYILRIPGGFSSDPRICLIPYTNTSPPIPNLELPSSTVSTELEKSSWVVEGEPYVGRLAGIFVNLYYITKVLDDLPLDEENNVNLMDFLKSLIQGITQSLGGINKINIVVTEDGLIKFIEEIPQRLKKLENIPPKTYARFNSFGVKPGIEGSFLTNIDLNAEIPSSFAATVAIGSQKNGNQKSGNATSFSNYNRGLKDRIIVEKALSAGSSGASTNVDTEQEDTITKNFENLKELFEQLYNGRNWFPEDIDTLVNLNTTHASLILGRLTQPDSSGGQQLQSSFFLPFNFSLEMEGLSGMKLYQKFKISEEILPPSYEKGGVDIQIKGINHTVNDNGWKTNLDTQSVPAAKLSEISTSYPLSAFSGGAAGAAAGGGGGSTGGVAGGNYDRGRIKSQLIGGEETTNGEVPDSEMAELSSSAKYKGDIQSDNGRIRLLKPVMAQLEKMLAKYEAENPNLTLKINSSYRTYEDQVAVRKVWERKGKPNNAAYPGRSNHGFGRAVDFANGNLSSLKTSMKQYKWIAKNASNYGFTRIGSGNWEAWHWEYLGTV